MSKYSALILLILLSACNKSNDKGIDQVELARFYAENNSFTSAISILNEEINKNSNNIQAHVMLAGIYNQLEYYADAEKLINRVRQSGCSSDRCKELEINILINNGRIEQVREILKDANSKSIPNYQINAIRIQYLLDKNIENYEKSLRQLNTKSSRKYLLDVLFTKKDYLQIIEMWNDTNDFTNDELLIIAKSFYVLEDYEKSEKVLLAFRLKDKSDVISRRKIESVELLVKVNIARGNFNEARLVYDAFLENNKNTGYVAVQKTLKDIQYRNFDQAIKNIEGLVKANPTNLQSASLLAMAHFGKGNYKKVIELLDPFRQQLNDRIISFISKSHLRLNQPERVIKEFSKNSTNILIKLDVAEAYLQINNAFEARNILGSIDLNKLDNRLKITVARQLYQAEMFQVLLDGFDKEKELPESIQIYILKSYLKLGQEDLASGFISEQGDALFSHELNAIMAQSKGETELAITSYQKLVNERSFKQDYENLSLLYLRVNQYENALRMIQQGVQVDGSNKRLLSIAEILILMKDNKSVIEWLLTIPSSDEDFKQTQLILAVNDLRNADQLSALNRLKQFEHDDDSKVLLLLSKVYASTNEDRSIEYLEKAFLIDRNVKVGQLLFIYYLKSKDRENLQRILRSVEVGQGLKLQTAGFLKQGYLHLKEFKKLEQIADYYRKNDKLLLALETEADVAKSKGDFPLAHKIYKEIIKSTPKETIVVKYFDSKLNDKSYRKISVLNEADRYLVANPDLSKLRNLIALKYLGINDSRARSHYENLYKKHPDSLIVLNNYAWSLLDIDSIKAVALAQKAHTLSPDDIGVADTYILALRKNKDFDKAKTILNAMLEKYPESEILLQHKTRVDG